MHRSRGTDIHPAADYGLCSALANSERIGHADDGSHGDSNPHQGTTDTGAPDTYGGAS